MQLKSLGCLGELFPEQSYPCRIRGCKNTWSCAGDQAARSLAQGNKSPEKMCPECFEAFQTLQDATLPCSASGCSGTWTWNRYQQLEARAQGRPTPPKGLCPACRSKRDTLADKEIPCRMKGCKNTWTWSKARQIRDGETPPKQLCQECLRDLDALKDLQVPCRMKGCKNTWLWNRYQRLEQKRAGKSPDTPPKRMCPACAAVFNAVQDRSLPCSTPGCANTWSWLRYDQVEHRLAAATPEAAETAPHKFCIACYEKWKALHDRQMKCAIPGCKGHWPYTRKMQFDDQAAGKTEPRTGLCEECQKKLPGLAPQQRPCSVPGCSGHWTCPPEEQLSEQFRERHTAQDRRCPDCESFLKEHASLDKPCSECGQPLHVSSYELLLAARSGAQLPERCADCAGKIAAAIHEDGPKIQHALAFRFPHAGPWSGHPEVGSLPPKVDTQTLRRAETASLRIVVVADSFGLADPQNAKAWPELLEERLGGNACVVNASISGCGSALAVLRLKRDLVTFQPRLALVSTTYADLDRQAGQADADALCAALKETEIPCCIILPAAIRKELRQDLGAAAQDALERQYLAARNHLRHAAEAAGLKVIDLDTSTRMLSARWMKGWNQLGEAGQDGVAQLLANEVRQLLHQ